MGGAFNPPHLGHAICAIEAAWQLGLERVLLVPVCRAPHRELDADPGSEIRLRMTELAVRDEDRLEASSMEVARGGTSYTYETLEGLARDHPGRPLVLVLGADQAATLGSWKHPDRVAALATLAVAGRPGASLDDAVETAREAGAETVATVDMPRIDISSTMVRERARAGAPFGHLVASAVADLIEREEIYS